MNGKKDEEKDVKKLIVEVIVSGLGLIVFSVLFEKGTELHYIIRGLGISIIGGALIAWAIGHLISKRKFQKLYEDMKELYEKLSETDKNINETVKETSKLIIDDTTRISEKIIATDKNINETVKETSELINENIRDRFDLIKECEDNGLLKIYEPFDTQYKKERTISKDFENDINKFLTKEKKEIKIYGISLRLFFNTLGKFEEKMSEAFENMNNNKVNIKILLISPYSDWAKQRKTAEKGFCDKIMQDLDTSIRWFRANLGNYNKHDEMYDNIRFYDAAPDFFLFITSECVIFEIYHTGIFQLTRDKETHRKVQDLGLGGHVPAFRFNSNSPMYKYLDAHFDYFFEKKIEGEPNKYHDGTLLEMLERLKKEPIIKASPE